MVAAAVTTRYVFDLQPGDVYWCTADCGWITGHSYLAYGPLLCGARSVIYEGVPSHPTPARCWQIVEKYKVRLVNTYQPPAHLLNQPEPYVSSSGLRQRVRELWL